MYPRGGALFRTRMSQAGARAVRGLPIVSRVPAGSLNMTSMSGWPVPGDFVVVRRRPVECSRLGAAVAVPDSAARAADSASMGSVLPQCRRAWRSGRSTSTTACPAWSRNRVGPAP